MQWPGQVPKCMHWIIRVPRWSLSATRHIFPALIAIGNMHTSYSEDNDEYLFIFVTSGAIISICSLQSSTLPIHHNMIRLCYMICTGLHNLLHPCIRDTRKWRENEKMKREWGNGERFTLYISSGSLYFLPLFPFPISKIVSFCHKMFNTFVANVAKKHARRK